MLVKHISDIGRKTCRPHTQTKHIRGFCENQQVKGSIDRSCRFTLTPVHSAGHLFPLLSFIPSLVYQEIPLRGRETIQCKAPVIRQSDPKYDTLKQSADKDSEPPGEAASFLL